MMFHPYFSRFQHFPSFKSMTWGLPCRNSWTFDVFPLYPEAYPLVNVYITNWKIIMLLMCKSTISTGPFSQFANCECHYRRGLIPSCPPPREVKEEKTPGIPENPRKSQDEHRGVSRKAKRLEDLSMRSSPQICVFF